MLISARSIKYRQGHIEVCRVHDGLVNIEVWQVGPDHELKLGVEGRPDYSEDEVIANTELELSIEQAIQLRSALDKLIAMAANHDGTG